MQPLNLRRNRIGYWAVGARKKKYHNLIAVRGKWHMLSAVRIGQGHHSMAAATSNAHEHRRHNQHK